MIKEPKTSRIEKTAKASFLITWIFLVKFSRETKPSITPWRRTISNGLKKKNKQKQDEVETFQTFDYTSNSLEWKGIGRGCAHPVDSTTTVKDAKLSLHSSVNDSD